MTVASELTAAQLLNGEEERPEHLLVPRGFVETLSRRRVGGWLL